MSARARTDHLVTTRPRRTTCERCKRVVLDGIADGLPYRADAAPLNTAGELAARLQGRHAYRVINRRLHHRDHHDVANDIRRGRPPVTADHRCTPIDPTHLDPRWIRLFTELVTDPTPVATEDDNTEQHALLILTGAFAGTKVLAIPADHEPPPF